ncbi:MAG: hypothetical protein ACKOLZ_05865, partial [Verrucomicrobiota bacterium]
LQDAQVAMDRVGGMEEDGGRAARQASRCTDAKVQLACGLCKSAKVQTDHGAPRKSLSQVGLSALAQPRLTEAVSPTFP